MSVAANKIVTYADYAALPEGAPYQLIGGELVLNPAPTPDHQRVSRKLEFELVKFIEKHNLGEVFYAPIDVYLSDTEVFQPDIIVILKDSLEIIGEKKIEAAPDIVIEILSPSTGYYDLRHKRQVYEASGVKEYWLVDPREQSVEILENGADGFKPALTLREKGRATSRLLPGFEFSIEAIF